jgi:DNA-directed RNA polymerase subunit RPC12/RpoP
MSEKLSEFVGEVKCTECGCKFNKGLKGQRPSCPQCGGKLLVKAIDDTKLIDD